MRKQCKRRIWAKVNPLTYVLEGIKPVSDEKLDRLAMRELSSLEAMSKGKGGLQEWTDINNVLSLCETMANSGVGAEALPSCKTLQDDLINSARRYEKTGKMGMTAQGIQAARDVIEYHSLQRQSVPLIDYERVIQLVDRMQKSKAPEVVTI